MIVERGEGKANAAQASRPNAARHFPQIRKHRTPTQHGTAKRFADKCCTAMSAHRMPLRHSGRPVQHLRRPSRSSAWFKGGEMPPCELRAGFSHTICKELCTGFSHTGGATSSLPAQRRIAGSEDAAPPRGLCASHLTIPLYLHTPKCAGVKNALRPYRLA